MMNDWITGDPLDERSMFSLEEVCRICGVQQELVLQIVEEGVVEPLGESVEQWRFTGIAVSRVQRVVRLQREFAVNLPGAALALELFEEIERLKRRA